MGNILASDSIEPYFPSTHPGETAGTILLTQTHRAPRIYKIKTMLDMRMDSGNPSGRVAHAVISNELAAHGIAMDVEVVESTGILPALNKIITQIDENEYLLEIRSVGKTPEEVQRCISSGRALAAALPVTQDVLDGNFDMPINEDEHFTYVPVVVWAYDSGKKKYICYTGLPNYEGEPVTIAEAHLLSADSCDFFSVVLTPLDPPLFLQDCDQSDQHS